VYIVIIITTTIIILHLNNLGLDPHYGQNHKMEKMNHLFD